MVTGKDFVPALAVQEYDHPTISRQPHHIPLGVDARAIKWLIVMPDHSLHFVRNERRVGVNSMTFNIGLRGHALDIKAFIKSWVVKPRGESCLAIASSLGSNQADNRG